MKTTIASYNKNLLTLIVAGSLLAVGCTRSDRATTDSMRTDTSTTTTTTNPSDLNAAEDSMVTPPIPGGTEANNARSGTGTNRGSNATGGVRGNTGTGGISGSGNRNISNEDNELDDAKTANERPTDRETDSNTQSR